MKKVINLTPEKNATRTVGEYFTKILTDISTDNFRQSYHNVTKEEWLDFDRIVDESVVFMFVRNPYDRLVSSFIHAVLSLDFSSSFPNWYFKLPIKKENQLECFKNFCKDYSTKVFENSHIALQTSVLDIHIQGHIGLSKFSIIPYLENKKIFIGKVEDIKSEIKKLTSLMNDNMFNENVKDKLLEHIGNNTSLKFSASYQHWYDDELYDMMTPVFKKELEILDYGF